MPKSAKPSAVWGWYRCLEQPQLIYKSADELEQLWKRFGSLDEQLKADTEQHESLFQGGPMIYRFLEMPTNFGITDFIASWG